MAKKTDWLVILGGLGSRLDSNENVVELVFESDLSGGLGSGSGGFRAGSADWLRLRFEFLRDAGRSARRRDFDFALIFSMRRSIFASFST